MSFLVKHRQILFWPLIVILCKSTRASSEITMAVLLNTTKTTATFKASFGKLLSTLDTDGNVNTVYKDFHSTFCDLGKFLEFVDGIFACHVIVVLLLDDCQCEKKFMSYLDIVNIKSVSKCERPLYATNVTSLVLKHVRQERQLYLTVPVDAHGVEFYQDFTFELQLQKLKLYRTLWVGEESTEETRLEKKLKSVAKNLENNITSGATFVVGFLYSNDFRLKSLVTAIRKIFGKQFGKILWIVPVMHWDVHNMQTFEGGSFHGLAFGSPTTVYCNQYNDENCAVYAALEKSTRVLMRCWNEPHLCGNSTEEKRNTTTAKSRVLNAERRHTGYSVKNQ